MGGAGTIVVVTMVSIFIIAVIKHVRAHCPDEPELPPEEPNPLYGGWED
jgi:hypothetical protein